MLKPKIRGLCKLEKDFQWQLTAAYKKNWMWSFKIPDGSMATKPYDMIMVDETWLTHHVECKITKDLSINVNDLRPNQRKSLWDISELNPCIAWVFVFSTRNNEYYCMRYLDFRKAANKNRTVKLFNSTWLIQES